MSIGDRWRLPGGHESVEMPGSTRDRLMLALIDPTWPWIKPPVIVARDLCERMPSRYLQGAVPKDDK